MNKNIISFDFIIKYMEIVFLFKKVAPKKKIDNG